MTAILFIIILAILIFVHELGHFLVAKWSGIRVDEFALGFPPKIFGKKIGETLYAVNLIPFGGYVKIHGENPSEEGALENNDKDRSFQHKSAWVKIGVLAAGVTMNVILAWIFLSMSLMSGMTAGVNGIDPNYITNKRVVVVDVLPDSPAGKAGIKSGMEVLAVSLLGKENLIDNSDLVKKIIAGSDGSELSLEIKNGIEKETLQIVPIKGIVGDSYGIGISMDDIGDIRLPMHKAFSTGASITVHTFVAITKGLYGLLRDTVMGSADLSTISGPIGIAKLVGEAKTLGFVYLLSFTAFISLNLAVLNLLPFPALDGGRILFVIIEVIKRSPIKPVVANTVNAIGFGILILLMIVVTVKDVLKLF